MIWWGLFGWVLFVIVICGLVGFCLRCCLFCLVGRLLYLRLCYYWMLVLCLVVLFGVCIFSIVGWWVGFGGVGFGWWWLRLVWV